MQSITLLIRRTFSLAVCAFAGLTISPAQPLQELQAGSFQRDTFQVARSDTVLALHRQFVLPGTELVTLDTMHLRRETEYNLDARSGTLRLSLPATSIPPGTIHTLSVRYQFLPFSFQRTYRHREPSVRTDTVAGQPVKVSRPSAPFSIDDLFGTNLQKSGSIVRGFTIGSNRDLSLSSGFRMQMSGNLTSDVSIIAALTDDNSPIQPEGTTRTLQEVDKVFIEVRGEDASATVGDFNLRTTGSEFANISRKLRGAKGLLQYRTGGTDGDALVSGASARGKFASNQFQGIDGVQGPYLLSGQNGERDIIVIAGTERVYIDGEQMVRGELNDYTIDYAVGEVTFTPHRLVSRVTRIVVDLEYTDRQFSRNFFAAQSNSSFLNRRLTLSATFFQENDDQDSPIDASLTDSDREILRQAGNDRARAVRSGVDSAGPGKGQYERIDSTVRSSTGGDSIVTTYRYDPADSLRSIYRITFEFVGAGNGDYRKISLQQYDFVGARRGDYLPVRHLAMPSSHRLADLAVAAQPLEDLRLDGEYSLSGYDANRFSSIDDDQNAGHALKAGVRYSPKHVIIGGTDVGSIDANVLERFVNKRYVSIDRINEVEFNRKWNITDSSANDEEIREGQIVYQPAQSLSLGGGFGTIRRGNPFESNRYNASANFSGPNLPAAQYGFELIKSRNDPAGLNASWTRQRGHLQYRQSFLLPGLEYSGELLNNRDGSSDTLRAGSFRSNELAPEISTDSLAALRLSAGFAWRWEDSLSDGALRRSATVLRQSYGGRIQEWNSISSSIDVTRQEKKFEALIGQPRRENLETLLLRWQTRIAPPGRGIESDLFYELATERSAKEERVFQRVPKGTGNYVYIGDANGNHAVDDPDFRLTRFDGDFVVFTLPADELVPVADLKTSARLRLNGDRLLAPDTWLNRVLGSLSTETYLRVEEKSTEPDRRQIYFLHLSRFLDDRTTLSGSNLVTQDLFVLEHNQEFSLRLRFSQRNSLNQFALSNERAFSNEQSVRIHWQLVKEIANQTDVVGKKDLISATTFSARSQNILSQTMNTDWSYRPEQQVELGFAFGTGRATNFDSTVAEMNNQSVRLTYSFSGRGQARAALTREEVHLSKPGSVIPFDLTGGRVSGQSWLWNMGFDYRITQTLQSTLAYDGRSEGGGQPVHTARVELRAFF
jgi:hypothetical protein